MPTLLQILALGVRRTPLIGFLYRDEKIGTKTKAVSAF